MSTYIKDTAKVNVFLQTRPTQAQSFQFPMVIIPHNLTANVIDSFSDLQSIVSANAAVNSPLYTFGARMFGGIAPPDLMKVARATLTTMEITVQAIPAEGEDISVNGVVNGVASVISYTIQPGDTTTLAAAGLEAALTAAYPIGDTSNPTFSDVANVITVTPGTVDPYSFSFGWQTLNGTTPHVVVEDKTTDSLVTVLTTAEAQDDDFSFVLAESHADADITALANHVNATKAQYFPATSDADAKDSGDTSNIAYTLSQLQQDGVSLVYHSLAENYFPEAGVIGMIAGIDPYRNYSVNNLTLEGVPIDSLTEQERITLTTRNTNYYIEEFGDGNYKEGWAMSGNFIDVVRFGNWLGVATETALYNLIKSRAQAGRNVPYSDFGALQMENRVTNDVINVGIRGGTIATGLTTDPVTGSTIDLNPVVNFGTRAQQTNVNIANRFWDDAEIEVVYISGIHHVEVNAYVVLNRDPIQ